MTALFELALGDDWDELHPQIRERYGVESTEEREAVGRGEMSRVTRNPLALPVLWLGTFDDFLFPEQGTDVPFEMRTEPFVDRDGNEALFLSRRFETDPPRAFVDTLRWNPERGCVTNFFGRRGMVAADLHLRADGDALVLELGRQWLRVRGRYLPQPGPFSVDVTVRDWYDDGAKEFNVSIEVRHSLVGRVFGCRGTFKNELRTTSSAAETESRLGGVVLPGVDA